MTPEPTTPTPRSTDALGDEIAALAAHISAATYRLLVLLREFDEREGWACGFRTCAHWLSWRIGMDLGAAREKVRVARALADLPLTSAAMERGELSYSKVRALTRIAAPHTEEELLHFARAGTAAHLEQLVRAWRITDAQESPDQARRQSRGLSYGYDEQGMLVLRARLEPESGAVLVRALEAAEQELWEETRNANGASDDTTPSQRRADALGLVAESALGDGLAGEHRGDDRYQVVVHVDEPALRSTTEPGHGLLDDGIGVSAETSRRLACDASRVVMKHRADGSALDVGRKTRTVPPATRRALQHRDRSCRFPGCTAKRCDAHHIEHWADGGETKLDNLVLLCRHHHRAVHEEGFGIERRPGGELRFFFPGGRPLPQAPVAPVLGIAAVDRLVAQQPGVRAEWPLWEGEGVDLEMAVAGFRAVAAGGGVSAER